MSDEQKTTGWTDPARNGRATGANGSTATGATATGAPTSTVPGPRPRGERPAEGVSPNVTEHLTAPVPDLATGPVPGPVPGPAAPVTRGAGSAPETSVPGPATVADKPAPTPAGTARPRPRTPRTQHGGRIGPWAPVAGAAVGVVAGIVVALVLRGSAETFDERLALVFVVLALALLGAGGTLLADETRLMRRGAQAAEARSSSAGLIAGLLNGLTPARLLVLAGGFVLLLSAYVTQGG